MIGWDEVYKVVVAMVPLYVALMLGYGSVNWWHMFTSDQSDAITRLNCYFIQPLFVFEFTTHVNPFKMNYRFIAADIISKGIVGILLGFWACCNSGKKGNSDWSITAFSLSSLNNTLVVGVPLMSAMYGAMGVDLVIQSSVLQSILWFMILLFMLELRRTREEFVNSVTAGTEVEMSGKDLEGNVNGVSDKTVSVTKPSFWLSMKLVMTKLARNPNSYACVAGLVWAFLSARWNFQMPSIMEGSILIMSKAGTGTAMFCMGLFMASQERIIACGVSFTLLGMFLRFIGGPLTMAIGSLAVGLHGQALRVAMIQAALPQSISSFIYAKEYAVQANVLSTAVIFGTVVSLPILIGYYIMLEFVH